MQEARDTAGMVTVFSKWLSARLYFFRNNIETKKTVKKGTISK